MLASFLSLFSVTGFSGASSPAQAGQGASTAQASAASDPRARIEQAFASASQATGLPFDYFMTTAMRESSLDVDAAATTSSARGPFQFIEQTWLGMMQVHGPALGFAQEASAIQTRANGRFEVANPQTREAVLAMRHDPELSAIMSGLYLQENAGDLEMALGRPVTVGEGYIAHVFGPSGASRLIALAEQQPGRTAADVFPTQAEANRGLFYDRAGTPVSLRQLYDRLVDGFPSDRVAQGSGVAASGASSAAGEPLSLMPQGFETMPTSAAGEPAYEPAGQDNLAARGLFVAHSGMRDSAGDTPFFAALYSPEGLSPRLVSEDVLATHGADRPQAEQGNVRPSESSVPNPMARPEGMGQAALANRSLPLDLLLFSRTGQLAELYRNPAAQRVGAQLAAPV